jgi:hypothetical protein
MWSYAEPVVRALLSRADDSIPDITDPWKTKDVSSRETQKPAVANSNRLST